MPDVDISVEGIFLCSGKVNEIFILHQLRSSTEHGFPSQNVVLFCITCGALATMVIINLGLALSMKLLQFLLN